MVAGEEVWSCSKAETRKDLWSTKSKFNQSLFICYGCNGFYIPIPILWTRSQQGLSTSSRPLKHWLNVVVLVHEVVKEES
jgi:hypothetical protein